MPDISLTDNSTLHLNASSADGNATLNRYLKSLLTFKTPPNFDAIANQKIADLDPSGFPIELSASDDATFAAGGATLDVKPGVSAALGLLKEDDREDFLSALDMPADPNFAAIVSFKLGALLKVGDSVTDGDFCFGISGGQSVALTGICEAAPSDTLGDAVVRAAAALTIPRDIADLRSLPLNAVCRVEAAGTLQFSASLTYSFLNIPLATTAIAKLPTLGINARASAVLEGSVRHTSGHTITVARLPSGVLHLAVGLTKIDDFETSLTASAGVTAGVGQWDALEFLMGKISADSIGEMTQIRAEMPPDDYRKLSGDIKSAIDAALSSSLQASLRTALDVKKTNNRLFVFEIAPDSLDTKSSAALQSALQGDFTALTAAGANLAGIRLLDAALTIATAKTHTVAVHLLGIFNWDSTHAFIRKAKMNAIDNSRQIVLSDETVQVANNNLDVEKLREVVLKSVTLTLPAAANTPGDTQIRMVFFDREGSAGHTKMQQFVNALGAIGSDAAARAEQMLNSRNACALFLDLELAPPQCRQLFLDPDGKARGWTDYIALHCAAQKIILAHDPDSAVRLRLYNAGPGIWSDLRDAGAASNMLPILNGIGVSNFGVPDAIAGIWWAQAMADYAKALEQGKSLVDAGSKVVKAGTLGFNEPWLVIAAWTALNKPAIGSEFTAKPLQPAMGAHGG